MYFDVWKEEQLEHQKERMAERRADGKIRTTEWEDVQYKFGNKVGKYLDNEEQIVAQRTAAAHPENPCKVYDPLSEKVEGKEDDSADENDDDDPIAAFRRRRLAELEQAQATPVFGYVRHITSATYVSDVTQGSEKNWVVLLMMENQHAKCEQLLTVFHALAQKHRGVKFLSIQASDAIKNFPSSELPCVLLYHEKQMQKQISGLELWGGREVTVETATVALKFLGIVELDEDDVQRQREAREEQEEEEVAGRYIKKY